MSVKSQVLEFLEQNRGLSISGQELAEKLNVSRAAVWKAVQSLREEGCEIHAANKKGYSLDPESDLLSEEAVRIHLPDRWKACPLCIYHTVDSTNTCAKRKAAEGAPGGLAVFADEQTAGRGRMGRNFYSPARTGLYMSLILRPEKKLEEALMTTVAAAVAVCRAIEQLTDARPQIKWVNDIYLDGRKICGILSEAVTDMESGTIESIVVGIGINIRTPMEDFPENIRPVAGSLSCRTISRGRLAAAVMSNLLDWQDRLSDPALMEEYRSRSFLPGKTIRYQRNGITESGLVLDINEKGNLIIQRDDGQQLVLSSGEVTIGSIGLNPDTAE